MALAELDLLLMSAVIFVPAIFALFLLFFPRGSDEWMRWWSLLGTAVTVVFSLVMFIDFYHDVIDTNMSGNRDRMTLNARAEALRKAEAGAKAQGHAHSDWIADYPWIPRFNIEYFLGVDGISMALVLRTTVL